MPPKRGGRARGGSTRGGRGVAASAKNEPATDSAPPSSTSAVVAQEDVEMHSANGSPASIPTETPAPTPIRTTALAPEAVMTSAAGLADVAVATAAPPKRTFKPKAVRRNKDERDAAAAEETAKRIAKASELEKEAFLAARAAGRGGARGRGQGRGRGRGDAMGSRGNRRPGDSSILGGASGPLGGGSLESGKRATQDVGSLTIHGTVNRMEGDAYGSGGLRFDADPDEGRVSRGIKSEHGSAKAYDGRPGGFGGGGGYRIKKEAEPVYSDDEEDGTRAAARVDIEHINLVSDSEDDIVAPSRIASRGKDKQPAAPKHNRLRPVRVNRTEHEERKTIVNTEPAGSSSKDLKDVIAGSKSDIVRVIEREGEDGSRKQQVAFLRDGKRWPGVWQDEEDPPIKLEADEDDNALAGIEYMKIDQDGRPKLTASSSAKGKSASVKATKRGKSTAKHGDKAEPQDIDSSDTEKAIPSSGMPGYKGEDHMDIDSDTLSETSKTSASRLLKAESKPKKAPLKKTAGTKKPVIQTQEDQEEYERYLDDVDVLSAELGGAQRPADSPDANTDADSPPTLKITQMEGRTYLFHLPSVLSPLRNPIKKEEPLDPSATFDQDVQMSGVPAAAENPYLKLEGQIKAEPGAATTDQNANGLFVVAPELLVETGLVGDLVVRASGKVELHWGDGDCVLGRGADFDFLAASMLVTSSTYNEEEVLMANGMGKLMGKFVARPDWEDVMEEDEGREVEEGDDDGGIFVVD